MAEVRRQQEIQRNELQVGVVDVAVDFVDVFSVDIVVLFYVSVVGFFSQNKQKQHKH